MGGDFAIIRWFWAANQDQGFEASVPFNFIDGRLNRQRKAVYMTVPCKLVTFFRWYRMNDEPLYVPVLGDLIVSVRLRFYSPWTTVQSSLLIDPTLERCQLSRGKRTTFPLHDSHVELQPAERRNTPACLDEGSQGFVDHRVLSIGPEAIDLASERRVVGAPVKD